MDGDRIVVPLSELGSGVRTWTITTEGSPALGLSLPETLALEFTAQVCNRAPRLELTPFANESASSVRGRSRVLGPLVAMEAIDEHTLLLFGARGLAWLRQEASAEPRVTSVSFPEVMPGLEPTGRGGFGAITAGTGERGSVELVTSIVAEEGPSANPTLIVARFTVSASGAFQRHELHRVAWSDAAPPALEHLIADPGGGYVAVGGDLIITSSRAAAAPRVELSIGRGWKRVLPGPSSLAPHLVLGRTAAFEGDLRVGVAGGGLISTFPGVESIELRAGAILPDAQRSAVAGFEDGRLYRRRGPGDWVRYPFGLPPAAGRCLGSGSVCGRQQPREASHKLFGSSLAGGLFVATAYCSTFFLRSLRDSCAQSFALSADEQSTYATASFVAMLELGGRVLLATQDGFIYALEPVVE